MTDRPTGIQVAPTEDEMNSVQDILKRAISAVVGMSQLQADVDMLRTTVSGLQADADRLRNHNESLDEALHQSRMTRNDLTSKLAQVETDLQGTKAERDRAIAQRYDCDIQRQVYLEDKRLAEQRADNAELRVMELEDELKAAMERINTARRLFALDIEPEHVKALPEPLPQAAPEMPKVWEAPDPVEVAAKPNRIYHDSYQSGDYWDVERQQYYAEAQHGD